MSKNRENVTWESADGTWSIGFFSYTFLGSYSDPNFDDEWNVEYDFSRFNWVSTGHRTEQEATDAWDGANPGGSSICEYCRDGSFTNEWNDHYDALAKALKATPANQRRR